MLCNYPSPVDCVVIVGKFVQYCILNVGLYWPKLINYVHRLLTQICRKKNTRSFWCMYDCYTVQNIGTPRLGSLVRGPSALQGLQGRSAVVVPPGTYT